MTTTADSPKTQAARTGALTRRRMLQAAAGALSGGVVAELIFQRSPPFMPVAPEVSVAVPPRPGLAATPAPVSLPMPMEEEPLPGDIREPVASSEALLDDFARHSAPAPKLAAAPVAPSAPAAPVAAAAPSAPATVERKPPAVLAADVPVWLRNAMPLVPSGGKPAIAVVIDDLGVGRPLSQRAIALDPAVTLAFMTYAEHLSDWTGAARAHRHEVLVHMPMQPLSEKIDAGPNALTVDMTKDQILDKVRWGLGRMDGYVGVNNHMGSRFTEFRDGMRVVLAELKSRGLLFLDSVTTNHSVCNTAASSLQIPFAERNVFLDNEITAAGVAKQIEALEVVARKHGGAIAIGHPHDATLSVLAEWLPTAAERGFTLMPLTSIMRCNVT